MNTHPVLVGVACGAMVSVVMSLAIYARSRARADVPITASAKPTPESRAVVELEDARTSDDAATRAPGDPEPRVIEVRPVIIEAPSRRAAAPRHDASLVQVAPLPFATVATRCTEWRPLTIGAGAVRACE